MRILFALQNNYRGAYGISSDKQFSPSEGLTWARIRDLSIKYGWCFRGLHKVLNLYQIDDTVFEFFAMHCGIGRVV